MSLRGKILLLTLFVLAGVLVAREEYLTRSAKFHQEEANRYVEMIRVQRNITPVEVDLALETARRHPDDARLDYKFRRVLHHRSVAGTYRATVRHPWHFVSEPAPPEPSFED